MAKYRIVRDGYAGYEVQRKRWWFPFWMQAGINTWRTVEQAKAHIDRLKSPVVYVDKNQPS